MTASLHLYELTEMRDVLSEWLEEADGEVTPELEGLLNDLGGQIDEKIQAVALYIQEQKGIAEAIKIEEDRLRARRHAREKAAESLRGYLKVQLERLGKMSVKGRLATVALQISPPAVTSTLTDEQMREMAHVSDCIITVPISFRLDRNRVLERVKAGDELPPGITVTRDFHVRIR